MIALMAKGLANKEIARQLDLAESTVKGHVESILRKFGAASRTEAAVKWAKERDETRSG